MKDWERWFAWRPVRSLYTTETIWLRMAWRRKSPITGWMYREARYTGSIHDPF